MLTGEIHALRSTDAGAVSEVVELLRDLLARAERGEVIGVAVAASCDRRADASSYAIGEGTIAALVLGLERCKRRLLDHCE